MAATICSGSLSLQQRVGRSLGARRSARNATRRVTVMAADRPVWLPGSPPASNLDGTMPGDFGFDPLGLGFNADALRYYREAELVHSRWAMLGCAGVLAQEIVRPDVFWYTAPATIELPINFGGLVAFQIFVMHWTELRRIQDVLKPGSVDQDPIFKNQKLAPHEVSYPGFAPFIPGDLETLKVKEIKNGRLAMLGFIGFTMAAQTTGKNPLAALAEHVADPINTNMFGKAVVIPGTAIAPPCALPASVTGPLGEIATPCIWFP